MLLCNSRADALRVAMVTEWTGVAVSLDGLGKDNLVDFICCNAGLGMGGCNLEYLSSKLLQVVSEKFTGQLLLNQSTPDRNRVRIHTVAAFLTPS